LSDVPRGVERGGLGVSRLKPQPRKFETASARRHFFCFFSEKPGRPGGVALFFFVFFIVNADIESFWIS
jgi:hypothetical protein